MIVLDIETSGLLPEKHSLLSIGAVHYETGAEFYGECRAEPGKILDPMALAVNGFTEDQCRDASKRSPGALTFDFAEWAAGLCQTTGIVLAGQQVGSFDIPFLWQYAGGKLQWEKVFSRRSVDLHSVAYAFLDKSLGLDDILKECELRPEPKPHNALTGAKLETEAFQYLMPRCRR